MYSRVSFKERLSDTKPRKPNQALSGILGLPRTPEPRTQKPHTPKYHTPEPLTPEPHTPEPLKTDSAQFVASLKFTPCAELVILEQNMLNLISKHLFSETFFYLHV